MPEHVATEINDKLPDAQKTLGHTTAQILAQQALAKAVERAKRATGALERAGTLAVK